MADRKPSFEPVLVSPDVPYDEIIAGLLAAAEELKENHPSQAIALRRIVGSLRIRSDKPQTSYELGRRDGLADGRAHVAKVGNKIREVMGAAYCHGYDEHYPVGYSE